MNIPRTIEYVASWCGVKSNEIWKCEAEDERISKPIEVRDIITSIHSQAGLSMKECKVLCDLPTISDDRSFSPLSIAASIIYIFCKLNKKKITLKKISNLIHVSEVSIHRCLKYLHSSTEIISILEPLL